LNTSMSIDMVGTSYILANAIGKTGYKYSCGGTGAVAQALAACLQNYGGIIRTDCETKRVQVKDGRATGVELATGEKIAAKAVVSNADPKRTFLKLIDRDALDDDFVRRVESLRARGTSLKINIALREPLNFKSVPGVSVGPQHTALTDIAPSMAYVEKASDECKWGRLPAEPPLSMFCQTASDPECAPPGKHTLSIIAKYNPYHLESGNWESLRETAQENALNVLEKYAPNLRSAILHIESLTPLDIERVFNLTEGNVTHLDQTLNQMLAFRPLLGWANYRTPIESLYMCGAGVHPGGGVSGAPGHNAAQALLDDLQSINASP
jgi:phytoene dehydrogenase-like protein